MVWVFSHPLAPPLCGEQLQQKHYFISNSRVASSLHRSLRENGSGSAITAQTGADTVADGLRRVEPSVFHSAADDSGEHNAVYSAGFSHVHAGPSGSTVSLRRVSRHLLLQRHRLQPPSNLPFLSNSNLSIAVFQLYIFKSNININMQFGMSSGLETLCGQAHGAKQYQRVGTFTYAAIICLFAVCIPISVVWIYTEELLLFAGQDPLISAEAGRYAIGLIPALLPYALLQCLVCYLQTQTLILPMLWGAIASLCFQLPLCWALLFCFNLGSNGAVLSIGISYWLNALLLLLYVIFSPSCAKTRPSFSKDIFSAIRGFCDYAIPSAGMVW